MIEINGLTKHYNGKLALNKVDLMLPRGQIVGLFGENGAGKSTLIKAIFGFVRYEGTITLDGTSIDYRNFDKLAFATSEHSFFATLSSAEHRDFYREHFKHFREKRFEQLIKFFDLPMHQKIKHLSFGQKNQFEVILALSQGADYIIMDEPFAGNDIFNREDFYKVLLGILEEGETILLSTHLIEEIEHFIDRAVLIKSGQIIGDISQDTLDQKDNRLVDYIKSQYNYMSDRVGVALDNMIK